MVTWDCPVWPRPGGEGKMFKCSKCWSWCWYLFCCSVVAHVKLLPILMCTGSSFTEHGWGWPTWHIFAWQACFVCSVQHFCLVVTAVCHLIKHCSILTGLRLLNVGIVNAVSVCAGHMPAVVFQGLQIVDGSNKPWWFDFVALLILTLFVEQRRVALEERSKINTSSWAQETNYPHGNCLTHCVDLADDPEYKI